MICRALKRADGSGRSAVINKDDGDNHTNVAIARHMYESALHILRRKYDEWQPRVLTVAHWEKRGIDEIGTPSSTSKPR
ncbi:hypothetical protein ACLBOM_09145 [Escherichia coli]